MEQYVALIILMLMFIFYIAPALFLCYSKCDICKCRKNIDSSEYESIV